MIWKRSCSNIRVRSGRRSKDDAKSPRPRRFPGGRLRFRKMPTTLADDGSVAAGKSQQNANLAV